MYSFPVAGHVGYGRVTQVANTAIQQLIRPFQRAWTVLTGFKYTCGTTLHTLTVRMPIGKTSIAIAPALSQAVVTLTSQPTTARNIVAADFLVVESHDTTNVGTGVGAGQPPPIWDLYKVTSVAAVGSLVITLTVNVVRQYAIGDTVWLMSLSSDAVPGYGAVHPTFSLPLSTVTELPSNALAASGGLVTTVNQHEPLVVESNNATAAGTLEYTTAIGFKTQSPHAA